MLKRVCVSVVLLSASACGGSSTPTAPTFENVQGQYSGTYAISSCSADGALVGFCASGGFNPGASFPILLSLTQSQDVVTGTVTLGSVTGTFQGSVAMSGNLNATATMNPVVVVGIVVTSNLTSWNTTLSGNNLAGSFIIVWRITAPSGTATVNATISRLSR